MVPLLLLQKRVITAPLQKHAISRWYVDTRRGRPALPDCGFCLLNPTLSIGLAFEWGVLRGSPFNSYLDIETGLAVSVFSLFNWCHVFIPSLSVQKYHPGDKYSPGLDQQNVSWEIEFKEGKIRVFPTFTPLKYKLNVICDICFFCCSLLSVAAKWGKNGENIPPKMKKAR